MKKMLLSIALAAMTLSANAADDQREYESLLSESKVWTMSYQGVVNPEVYGDGIPTELRMWCWIWMCL